MISKLNPLNHLMYVPDQLAGQNSEALPTANGDVQHNSLTNGNGANYYQNVYGVGIRVGDMLGEGGILADFAVKTRSDNSLQTADISPFVSVFVS